MGQWNRYGLPDEAISEWARPALIEGQLEEFLLGTNRFEGGLANLFELPRYPWREPGDECRRRPGGIGAEQRLRNPASKDYALHAALMFELELQNNRVGDEFGLAHQVEDINATTGLKPICQGDLAQRKSRRRAADQAARDTAPILTRRSQNSTTGPAI